MIIKNAYKNLVWIDISTPDKDEIREIAEEYNISPAVADELLAPTESPRVEYYGDYVYAILHFPAFKHSHNDDPEQEVNFILGKDFLITVRYDEIDPLHKFAKIFEVNTILDKQEADVHSGYVFLHMLRKLYISLRHEIEFINDTLDEIEEKMYQGLEKEMVFELSYVNRGILRLKQTINPHAEMLDELSEVLEDLFDKEFKLRFSDVWHEYSRVRSYVDDSREELNELRETNNSLLNTKQNEIMKVLTIMAFVTFPLSLLASIFGMNTATLPIVGEKGDFWIIVGIMVILTALFFLYFRYKRWL